MLELGFKQFEHGFNLSKAIKKLMRAQAIEQAQQAALEAGDEVGKDGADANKEAIMAT